MSFRRRVLLPFFIALAVSASAAAAPSAKTFLEERQSRLTAIVAKNEPGPELQRAFDEVLDYAALAENSLGEPWATLTPEQRAEFQGLLTTLVQRAYTKNIRDTLNFTILFGSEEAADGSTLVHTRATHKTDQRREAIVIDYVLVETKGVWKIRDIVTDGSSLVQNYRSQFRKVIDKSGFSGLIAKMKKKVAEG